MQARFAWVALLGFVLIAAAACSRSDGLSTAEEEALQERVEQAELEAAEAERRRQAEEEARKAAEEEAAEAERAEQEAAAAAEEAERLRQAEEEARQAAESERNRLEAEAEARRRADATEAARVAITGTRTIVDHTDRAAARPTVGPIIYGEPVPLTAPAPPFTTTTSRSGRWAITEHADVREASHHTVEIYTDVEMPTREAFRTSRHNTANVGPTGTTTVIDGTNMVIGWVNIVNGDDPLTQHGRLATSGSFPREIGNAVPFALVDRGLTETEYGTGPTDSDNSGTIDDTELAAFTPSITRAQYNQYRAGTGFRVESRFPQRYAYTTSGQLQGAGGTYRCDGDAATDSCTVQNRGGSFEFVGDWDFIPSSGTVTIVVPDGQYMWFGWWAQRTVEHPTPDHPTDIWAFQANHGGYVVTTLTDATGPATYRGPAAGHYAVYEPDTGDSGIGSFTASATLQADFDNDIVSGTITNFSNDSSWSLGLKQSAITGGNAGVATDGVTWTIDGIPDDSGAWEASFYTNLDVPGSTDTSRTITYQPHGIAGTFQAAYDPSGAGARAAVIGGFGAHR